MKSHPVRSQGGGALTGLLAFVIAIGGFYLTFQIAGALFSEDFWRSAGLNPAIGGVLGLITMAVGGFGSLGVAGWIVSSSKKG